MEAAADDEDAVKVIGRRKRGRSMGAKDHSPAGAAQGFSAVVRRFPTAEFAIRKLMNRNADFGDMCEELAEAERALSRVHEVPAELREARRAEWQELVDRLVAEVGIALHESDASQIRKGQRPTDVGSS
jgi:hypothetical protein